MPQSGENAVPQSAIRGVFWICTAMLVLVGQDAISKYLTQDYPVAEVIWARFTFHLLFMVPLIVRRFPVVLMSRGPRLQFLRGLMILLAAGTVVTALHFIPLAETIVLFSINPLIVTALSVPFLKERVGLRQWIGVVVGFFGVLLIVRPGFAAVHPAALLLVLGAGFYAISQLVTRRLGQLDDTRTTVLYTGLLCCVVMTAIVPFVWITPDILGWALMAGAGALSLAGHLAAARAFQVAPAATVTPFNYSGLIWATLFGFLIFGDLPDRWTVAGALVIAGSSLYVLARRRRRQQETT